MIKTPKSLLKECIGLSQKMHSNWQIDTPPHQNDTLPQFIDGVTRSSLHLLKPSITFVFDDKTCLRTLLNIPAYIHMLVVCFEAL